MSDEKLWWSTSSGRIELELTLADAESGAHQGQCDEDVRELSRVGYIESQIVKIDPALLASELKEYGAWDAKELADHEQNIQRMLWIACNDVKEEWYESHKQ